MIATEKDYGDLIAKLRYSAKDDPDTYEWYAKLMEQAADAIENLEDLLRYGGN